MAVSGDGGNLGWPGASHNHGSGCTQNLSTGTESSKTYLFDQMSEEMQKQMEKIRLGEKE